MNKQLILLPIMSLVLLGLFSQTYAKNIDMEFYVRGYPNGKETLQDTNTVGEAKSLYAGQNRVFKDKIKFYLLKDRSQIKSVPDESKLEEMKKDKKLGDYKPKEGPILIRVVVLPGAVVPNLPRPY